MRSVMENKEHSFFFFFPENLSHISSSLLSSEQFQVQEEETEAQKHSVIAQCHMPIQVCCQILHFLSKSQSLASKINITVKCFSSH